MVWDSTRAASARAWPPTSWSRSCSTGSTASASTSAATCGSPGADSRPVVHRDRRTSLVRRSARESGLLGRPHPRACAARKRRRRGCAAARRRHRRRERRSRPLLASQGRGMNLTWDVARAGGLVAWGLATASVMWGLVLSTRLMRKRPWPAWFLDLHRLLGGLAVIFTVIHV